MFRLGKTFAFVVILAVVPTRGVEREHARRHVAPPAGDADHAERGPHQRLDRQADAPLRAGGHTRRRRVRR
jgi:hypothetical protein